jgi:hypothetical protein
VRHGRRTSGKRFLRNLDAAGPSFDDLLICFALQYIVDSSAVSICREGPYVLDLFFLAVTVIFFVGCLAYIVGCERL